jgi:hypothetical protein
MTTYFSKYLSHPQYAKTYRDILRHLGNVDNEFLFSELRGDILELPTMVPVLPDNLFNKLEEEEKGAYLKSLREITRIRKMFRCGYELPSDEVLLLLQRSRTKQEAVTILCKYPIPYAWREILLESKRPITRLAAEKAIKYNLRTSVEWAYLAAQILPESYRYSYSKYDFEISNLLIEKNEYAKYFKLNADNNVKLLCYSLSLMNKNELMVLNSSYKRVSGYESKDDSISEYVMFTYLCLLKYFSEKNNLVFELDAKLRKLFLQLWQFRSLRESCYNIENSLKSAIVLVTAKSLPLYASKFSKKEYRYVLSNLGITEELTNRSDMDFEFVYQWVKDNQVFRLDKTMQDFGLAGVKFSSFNTASYFIRNEAVREDFYKLIPYLILAPSHQYLTFSIDLGIFRIFVKDDVSAIQKLYDEVNETNYPSFTIKELRVIKRRISYAFRNNFSFKDGVFFATDQLASHYSEVFAFLSSSTIDSMKIDSYFVNRHYNYHDMLMKVKNRDDIEKIILVGGNISSDLNTHENFGVDKNQKLVELILSIIKPYNIEKSKVAIILAKDWHGTKEEFISMMEVI